MALTPGTRLGPYEIVAPLGAGGMGEVWRARDTRLPREVAIKALPADFSGNRELLERLEQEARAASSLNHPNIISLFDVGEHEGTPFLVTELLEGQTLRALLATGVPPRERALAIALQVARGLAAAHSKGIVHRDLKPENVFVTRDGQVKILDFGLAKLPPSDSTIQSTGPTALTPAGAFLGTLGYTSPEQAKGLPADHRSDLFSFGVLLYELLTGHAAFRRATTAETVAAILREDPLASIAPGTRLPAELRGVVGRCLEKEPGKRFESAAELVRAIERTTTAAAGAPRGAFRSPARVGILALAAVVLAGIGYVTLRGTSRAPAARLFRLTQVTSAEGVEESPAWSPDGRRLVYSASVHGIRRLVLKGVPEGEEAGLTRGEYDDVEPTWSPDGRRILFIRAREAGKRLEPRDIFGQYLGADVWSLEVAGGAEALLVENAFHPAYAPDGTRIAVDAQWAGGSRIWLVDAQGHNPRQLTTETSEAVSHLRPRWSPDGRWIAFQRLERTKFDIAVVNVETQRITRITDDVFQNLSPEWSRDGRALYFSSQRSGGLNLWRIAIDREGRPAGAPEQLTSGAGQDVELAVAPDGGRLAFTILRQNANLWKLPLDPLNGAAVGPPEEVTATTREDSRGAWSPDGRRIAFNSDRQGTMNIWLLELDTGATRQLTAGEGGDFQPAWSYDGRRLAFFSTRAGNADIWEVEVGGGALRQLTRDRSMDINPCYSPDGAWIAFQSDRNGRLEVWVMRADGTEPRRLTNVGVMGHFLRWTADGSQVVFRSPEGGSPRVMSIPVAAGEARPLAPIQGGSHLSFSPDGSRILDVVDHKTLWVSPLAGGEPTAIFHFDDPADRIDYPVWSPDGRWALFDRFRPEGGDIWILEGLK